MFEALNIKKLFFLTYLIYFGSGLATFILIGVSSFLSTLISISFSLIILFLSLEIIYKFELQKRRFFLLCVFLISPVLFVLNKDNNIILGLIGNVFGLYFFAQNLFVMSIPVILISFTKFHKYIQFLIILILSLIISFIFISTEVISFYQKPPIQYSILNEQKIINPNIDKNGKYLIGLQEMYDLNLFKLNPFNSDITTGGDQGCDCIYWKTREDSEYAYDIDDIKINKNSSQNIITKFSDKTGTYFDADYHIKVDKVDSGVAFLIYSGKPDDEVLVNQLNISGGYIKEKVNDRGSGHLDKQYYSRSIDVFLHSNVFVLIYQTIYNSFFVESAKNEILDIVDRGLRQIIVTDSILSLHRI